MQKSKTSFNIIDFIIVIAILGCIAGVAIRYDVVSKIGANNNKDEVEIAFLVEGIKYSSTEALVEGDTFYWGQNNMEVGKLLSKEVSNAVVYVVNDNFEINKTYNDLKYDVRGVLSATGKLTEDGFMLDGTQFIGPGKSLLLKSRNISVTVTVTAVTPIE